jgi:iron complex transport system ATP-binding protein
MEKIIEISNVSVILDDKIILKNINWTVYEDENWAIIGKNGSGKSFLLRLLSANLFPNKGSVKIFGKEFGKVNLWDLKSEIGFISDLFLRQYDQGSKVCNVVYSGFFSSNGLYEDPTELMIERTDIILKELDLYKLKGLRFGEISHGEQKRVLIARALVFNPRILVFDEPCTGLDIAARENFLSNVEKLAQKGHNIVFVTHHIEEVIPAINKILYLKYGEIGLSGNKKEMLNKKNLNNVLDYNFELNEKNGRYSISF